MVFSWSFWLYSFSSRHSPSTSRDVFQSRCTNIHLLLFKKKQRSFSHGYKLRLKSYIGLSFVFVLSQSQKEMLAYMFYADAHRKCTTRSFNAIYRVNIALFGQAYAYSPEDGVSLCITFAVFGSETDHAGVQLAFRGRGLS